MSSTVALTQVASSATSDFSANNGLIRVVRFDSECVLIPESPHRSKRPKMLTKSYTLPLWKRKNQQHSDAESIEGSSQTTLNPEETHVVLKVPIPAFGTKRERSISPSPKPLSPCLVHRQPSVTPNRRQLPMRRPSLPIYHIPKVAAMTVPLRACCSACERITEESMLEGTEWQEQFSRGARRRRSASLDNASMFVSALSTTPAIGLGQNLMEPAFVPRSRYGAPNFSLTVDEVDKRRKSMEFSSDDFRAFRTLSAPSPFDRSHLQERDAVTPSLSVVTTEEALQKPRASPIQEEDENQLFPLPSPRRTPSGSPSSSIKLSTSPKSSPLPSPASSRKPSPTPSPNFSTACLDVPTFERAPSPEEGILRSLLGRKIVETVVPSSITPASSSQSTDDIQFPVSHSQKSASPTVPYAFPKKLVPSSLSLSLSRHARSQSSPSPTAVTSPGMVNLPSPTIPSSPQSNGGTGSKTSSPKLGSSPKQRKQSFTLPFFKAGADVLKGVSSISSSSGFTGA